MQHINCTCVPCISRNKQKHSRSGDGSRRKKLKHGEKKRLRRKLSQKLKVKLTLIVHQVNQKQIIIVVKVQWTLQSQVHLKK